MTREKALELMDALNELGYSVTVLAAVTDNYIHPDTGTDHTYAVSLAEMAIDKIDVKALVELADAYEVDIGYSPIGHGTFSFSNPDIRPEVIKARRRHPRAR